MTLFYLVFGENQHNHIQAYFSICSFLGQIQAKDKIYVLTDAPQFYQRFGDSIKVVVLDKPQLDAWEGPHRFFWRVKIKALEYICRAEPQDDIMYLDTDTFLYGSLPALQQTLAQSPMMHLHEGALAQLKSKTERKMWQQVGQKTFGGVSITPQHGMWNAGVVALPANIALSTIQNALAICDDMLAANVTRRLIEQFALSVALTEAGTMQAADTFIGHYWSNKPAWNDAIYQLVSSSFLGNRSLETDVQQVLAWDFGQTPIQQRIPNTQVRLKKLIERYFPTKAIAYIQP